MKKSFLLLITVLNSLAHGQVLQTRYSGNLYSTPFYSWKENGFNSPEKIDYVEDKIIVKAISFYLAGDENNYVGDLKVEINGKIGWMSSLSFNNEDVRKINCINCIENRLISEKTSSSKSNESTDLDGELYEIKQEEVDTSVVDPIEVDSFEDITLIKKRELAIKDFAFVSIIENEGIYSVKIINEDSFGKKIWLRKSYPYIKVKNKNGKWIEKKKEGEEFIKYNLSCSDEMYELLEYYIYDGKGKVVSSSKGIAEEYSIVPDSLMDKVSKIVCF